MPRIILYEKTNHNFLIYFWRRSNRHFNRWPGFFIEIIKKTIQAAIIRPEQIPNIARPF